VFWRPEAGIDRRSVVLVEPSAIRRLDGVAQPVSDRRLEAPASSFYTERSSTANLVRPRRQRTPRCGGHGHTLRERRTYVPGPRIFGTNGMTRCYDIVGRATNNFRVLDAEGHSGYRPTAAELWAAEGRRRRSVSIKRGSVQWRRAHVGLFRALAPARGSTAATEPSSYSFRWASCSGELALGAPRLWHSNRLVYIELRSSGTAGARMVPAPALGRNAALPRNFLSSWKHTGVRIDAVRDAHRAVDHPQRLDHRRRLRVAWFFFFLLELLAMPLSPCRRS